LSFVHQYYYNFTTSVAEQLTRVPRVRKVWSSNPEQVTTSVSTVYPSYKVCHFHGIAPRQHLRGVTLAQWRK